MDEQKDTTKIIDWRDRKEVMATYRKYEELNMTGPCSQYYNGKLLPVSEPPVMITDPIPYRVEDAPEDNHK